MQRFLLSVVSVFFVLGLSSCTEKFEAVMTEGQPSEVLADGDVHFENTDHKGFFIEHKTISDPLVRSYSIGPAKANRSAKVTTILNNGRSENRVNMVIVGDGYATNNLGQYEDDAESVTEKFLEQEPLLTYSTYINVHRVDVISSQSGVDQDPKGVNKDTALGMGFWCSGIERLLCANMQKVKEYAANAPKVDLILAVANTAKYGGAGYWKDGVATLPGRNASAVEVALHEIGHSFAQLGDEYPYAGSSSSDCAAKANGSTSNKAKIIASKLKWFRWMDLPHIGAFEGACYKESGIFRPTQNSKMRTLGQPFYEVNTEQYILSIYKLVKPIDSATAPGTYKRGVVLKVVPMRPVNHALSIQWYLGNSAIAGQTSEALDTSVIAATRGSQTVSVQVVDRTTRVRDEVKRESMMSEKRSWKIAN